MAKELALDWHTVKALEMQYMEAQLARVGRPGPLVIGIDEIAIRKGHTYRIVVSDLRRGRPIWFGGDDRSEASMAQFYAWLGARKSARIRLAVMDPKAAVHAAHPVADSQATSRILPGAASTHDARSSFCDRAGGAADIHVGQGLVTVILLAQGSCLGDLSNRGPSGPFNPL